MTSIVLKPPTSVSASSAEILRQCPLRVMFSKSKDLHQYVLGSPFAWLGTIYHEVLEQAWIIEIGSDAPDVQANQIWDDAVSEIMPEILAHPLRRRFSIPEKWPKYYLSKSIAVLKAKEVLLRRQEGSRSAGKSTRANAYGREKMLRAREGKLIGAPDVFIGDDIWDYKTGSVVNPDAPGEAKDTYARQLKLYGYLVGENYGHQERVGHLVPMAGQEIAMSLKPEECEQEADRALTVLREVDESCRTCDSVGMLASPAPEVCAYCCYKLVCDAYWGSVDSDYVDGQYQHSVKGIAVAPPQVTHGGKALSLSIEVVSGTIDSESVTVRPLSDEVHSGVAGIKAGDAVRIEGLRKREDGSVCPADYTVCQPESCLPGLLLERP